LLGRGDRIRAKDFDAARSRPQFSRDLSQKGRFARAIRAEDRNEFSSPYFKIDAAIGFGPVAILLCEATHANRSARFGGLRTLFRGVKFFGSRLVDFADQDSGEKPFESLNSIA
jgi:hypothetical protein